MSLAITRLLEAERVFPPITPDLYQLRDKGNLTSDQRVAVQLLGSSEQISIRRKYFKKRPNGRDCLNRPLFLHRNAFEFELEGQFQRADFFWQELYADLTSLFESETAWPAVAASLCAEHSGLMVNDPVTLRARFIEEVLIDTHAAFFNGHAKHTESLTVESRAWKHFGYLEGLLKWSDWTTEDKYNLIREVADAEILLLEEAKRWKELEQLCKQLISYCPDSIQYRELLCNATLSERVNYYFIHYQKLGRVDSLKAAIKDLECLRTNDPLSVPFYEKLGSLHYDLAVTLAEQGQISTALLAAQKAVIFGPCDNHGALLDQLTQLMKKMQLEAKECDLRGLRFQKTGAFMLDEVRVGFRLLEKYINSEEPGQISEALRIARAKALWRKIGLPAPPPTDLQNKSEAYVLEPATASPSQLAATRFDFWLLSGRDLRLKVQAAAAIVVLFVAVAVFLVDMNARRVRATSYQSVIQGSQTRNYLQVIEGAEAFLSHPLVATRDSRDEEVIEHYNKALVLWVARQPGQINADVSLHVERYRQLVGNRPGRSS